MLQWKGLPYGECTWETWEDVQRAGGYQAAQDFAVGRSMLCGRLCLTSLAEQPADDIRGSEVCFAAKLIDKGDLEDCLGGWQPPGTQESCKERRPVMHACCPSPKEKQPAEGHMTTSPVAALCMFTVLAALPNPQRNRSAELPVDWCICPPH